ncbi:hypothetical protein [Pseudogulbenkiania subflava]|uniref:Lipoprotein n=1 Tax=Pseudogulbenkiania subflava DSM 22618 TaxID=1123014 RepID=A0A1Y6C5K6_9NEIS|nr:hypothetical protein [Pseudogulbenkiania subflava]SMF35781.1 hypothetical protein SAMN02745746_02752 [Pseudogulbenkiania subflava DSM 22618]
MKALILVLVAATLSGCVIRPLYPYHDRGYDGDYHHRDYGGRGGWRR